MGVLSALRRATALVALLHAGSALEGSGNRTEAGRTGDCPWDFTVYVYEFPEHLQWNADATELKRKGRQWYGDEEEEDMFALEVLLHKVFLTSCVRTLDPDTATFKFVPFYADVDFRLGGRKAAPSEYGLAIKAAVEEQDVHLWESTFGVTGKYWLAQGGWDHIVVFAAPLTSWTHEKSRRGLFHNKKMLIPPIVANVELLNRFVAEYPHCGGQKNLLLPYPSGGVAWADGTHARRAYESVAASFQHPPFASAVTWVEGVLQRQADPWAELQQGWSGFTSETELIQMLVLANKDLFAMAIYGMMHDCKPLRAAIRDHLKRDDCILCVCNGNARTLAGSGRGVVYHGDVKTFRRQELSHRPLFCPCPAGDSPSAKRMYDVVRAGCIPVILSDDFIFPWSQEGGLGDLPEASYSVRIPTDALDGYDSPQMQRRAAGKAGNAGNDAYRFAVADDWGDLSWFQEAHEKIQSRGGGLGSYLRSIPPMRVKELLEGVERVQERFFNFWKTDTGFADAYRADGSRISLLAVDSTVPDGGAVTAMLNSLQAKVGAPYRAACEAELKASHADSGRGYC